MVGYGRTALPNRARRPFPHPLAFDPPRDDSLGMDPDQRPFFVEGLSPSAHLYPTRTPRIGAREIVDHDRRAAAPPSVAELLGPGEVPAADVDRLPLRVVAPADGDDVRCPVLSDGGDPPEAALRQVLPLVLSELSHRQPPVTSLLPCFAPPRLEAHP